MSLTNTEKNRRESKKMYEIFDEALQETLKDPEAVNVLVKQLATVDPKLYINTVLARLPRVQPVDQDLQKTLISLKAMMQELPDVDDIISKLHLMQGKVNKLESELELKKKEVKLLQKKISERA